MWGAGATAAIEATQIAINAAHAKIAANVKKAQATALKAGADSADTGTEPACYICLEGDSEDGKLLDQGCGCRG